MKIAATLLLLLQFSAPGPENWSYLTCMASSASVFLRNNPSRDEYRRHIGTACNNEKARLRRHIVEQQIAKGRSLSQADQDADEFFAIIGAQLLDLQPVSDR